MKVGDLRHHDVHPVVEKALAERAAVVSRTPSVRPLRPCPPVSDARANPCVQLLTGVPFVAPIRSEELNYDTKYVGATSCAPITERDLEALRKDGYMVNHARVELGSGADVYRKAKNSLTSWR